VWGSNVQNQLGIGQSGGLWSRSTPGQVGALTNWARVDCGVYQTLALKTDGTLWAVGGDNTYGQLGLNDTASRSSPVQIGTSTTWASFSTGTFHVAAIKTDGSLYTWGRNNVGQLGQGNTTNLSNPTQVGTGTDWASVLAFGNSTLALKTNSTLWGWGLNTSGQLGIASSGRRTFNMAFHRGRIRQRIREDQRWAGVDVGGQYSWRPRFRRYGEQIIANRLRRN
jgi:alpha-tubulin suppressor-like RCC1 family protein